MMVTICATMCWNERKENKVDLARARTQTATTTTKKKTGRRGSQNGFRPLRHAPTSPYLKILET